MKDLEEYYYQQYKNCNSRYGSCLECQYYPIQNDFCRYRLILNMQRDLGEFKSISIFEKVEAELNDEKPLS